MSDRDVYERFAEVIPRDKLENLDIIEVERATRTAFRVIGYVPRDFKESFNRAWRHSVAVMLFEFVFDVYMEDRK